MKKVSIIIPTYKRKKILMDTLSSLLNQTYEDFEIIIIDQEDSFRDELKGVIDNNKGKTKYLTSNINSASLARNIGIKNTTGEIVICCDDDVIAAPDFIKNHTKNYEDASIGSVSGRVICSGDLPAEKIKQVGKLRKWDGKIIGNFNAAFRTEIDHAYGCNVSYRKDLLVRVKGYDERLIGTGSFDDADVSLKIRRLGYKVIFDPAAEVRHLRAKGGYRDLTFRDLVYWYYHNFIIFYLKHIRNIFFPFFLGRQVFGIIRRSLIARDSGLIIYGIKGLIYGLRDYFQKSENTVCL